jgi:hypothetical protein
MSRKNSGSNGVRLFDSDNRYQCHIAKSEAETMLAAGTHEVAYEHRCGDSNCAGCERMHAIGIKKRSFHKSSLDTSDCSLSEFDMQALVGITPGERGAPPVYSLVAAAEDKVAAWPHVGDPKAVRVRPRFHAEARV